MAIARVGSNIVFYSADTNGECAALTLRDTSDDGRGAISPDGKLFAWISRIVGGDDFCVEVYSLRTGRVQASRLLEKSTHQSMCFSPDSKHVLVGTRDTVEIMDIEEETWQDAVSLTPPDDRDAGRTVNRQVPLGLGFPGDLYTSFSTVLYSKPAALTEFDVSPSWILAVGSEVGNISLVKLDTKEVVGQFGDKLPGAEAELVMFSPNARHLVAYAKGMLHLFRFDDAGRNSHFRPTIDSPDVVNSGTITAVTTKDGVVESATVTRTSAGEKQWAGECGILQSLFLPNRTAFIVRPWCRSRDANGDNGTIAGFDRWASRRHIAPPHHPNRSIPIAASHRDTHPQ